MQPGLKRKRRRVALRRPVGVRPAQGTVNFSSNLLAKFRSTRGERLLLIIRNRALPRIQRGSTSRVRRDRVLHCTIVVLIAVAVLGPLVAAGSGAPQPAQPRGIISRIERRPVESRALAAVGYSNRLRALEVEFRRGGTYRYLDVPRGVYDALLAAESKARFYNQHVRGKYRSVYVRPRRSR